MKYFTCRSRFFAALRLRLVVLAVFALALLPEACRAQVKEKPLDRIRLPAGYYTLEHNERQRRYALHLPKGREHDSGLPLVIALHGAPGNGLNMMEWSGLAQKADEAGFIAVFPDGTSAMDPIFLNWNSGSCCGYAWENKIDDVGFLRSLVSRLDAEYHIDRRRVFATGFSKGGMMAYRLACEASDLFAGIADVAGAFNLAECNPERPIDVLIVHGRADKIIPFGAGLPPKILPLADWDNRPVAYAVDFWQRHNLCQPGKSVAKGSVEETNFLCRHARLRLISLANDGHAWPGAIDGLLGAEQAQPGFSVNDAIWDFFVSGHRVSRAGGPVPH